MDLGKILIAMYAIGVVMCFVILIRELKKQKGHIDLKRRGWWKLALIGCYTNFFDTWGIGSFAPSIVSWKFFKAPLDEIKYPGTLNFGYVFPVAAEAILFTTFVEVDGVTLFTMVVSSAIGAWIGVSIVSKMDIQKIRLAMCICLICTAIVLSCKNAGVGPFGLMGTALGLSGWKLIVAIILNFFWGAGMMIGFGLYIPCTATCALLGMNIASAFPIFMGSCCLLMIASVPKWSKTDRFDVGACVHGAIFGTIGVVAAYLLFKYAFDMKTLAYLMAVVMVYTAIIYIRDYTKEKKKRAAEK